MSPALVYPYGFVAGDVPIAARLQGDLDAIATLLNSTKLDQSNIQALAIITALINDGAVTADKLSAAVRDAIGLNSASTVHRGKSIIATEEARTNTSFGLMTTPDRVQNIVLSTDGLIKVAYHANWKQTLVHTARAAIFVGANQLKVGGDNGGPLTQAASMSNADVNVYKDLFSHPGGLLGGNLGTGGSPVSTGQAVGAYAVTSSFYQALGGDANQYSLAGPTSGGFCLIFATAGTYDISVQFKATAGTVTAQNRKLWVEAVGF